MSGAEFNSSDSAYSFLALGQYHCVVGCSSDTTGKTVLPLWWSLLTLLHYIYDKFSSVVQQALLTFPCPVLLVLPVRVSSRFQDFLDVHVHKHVIFLWMRCQYIACAEEDFCTSAVCVLPLGYKNHTKTDLTVTDHLQTRPF